MTTPEKVMETLKERKAMSGLTNQQLADATGIPLSNIKKYFAGDIKNPSLFYTAAACEFFGISLDDLMGLAARERGGKDFEKELAKERKARIITTAILAAGIVVSMLIK